ncbi:uncharacterized protein LOC114471298 isoform X2 [Gouania willdenowi]|nr:uncharacterized protein LOC114471298 isoform X2 [Gouania willdenowi]
MQLVIKKGMRRNHLQPLRLNGVLQTNAFKFGPMLTNSLMATSISKAVQVLGAMHSLQQLKLFLTSSCPIISQDDTTSSTASNINSTILPASTPCSSKTETEKAVFDENSQEDFSCLRTFINQTLKPSAVPQKPATLPESGSFKPTNISPLTNWKRQNDAQVQHHRQTSFQLLNFLRKNTFNISAVQGRFREWNKNARTLEVLEPTAPVIKRQTSHVVKDDHTNGVVSEMSKKNRDNQAPVFSFKKRESNSLITYSCVITTETELWDIIDVPIEKALGGSVLSHLEGNECSKTIGQVADFSVNSHGTTQTVKSAEPDYENIFLEAKTQTCTSVNMIPQFQIRKFEEAEVVVSHIVSPGNFYIQYADWDEKLHSLITESFKASSSYAEKKCIPDLGTLVMAWFPMQNKWCRAQVMKVCGICKDKKASDSVENRTSIVVEVKRLDYGDAVCLSLQNIKQLTPEMTVLPLQAVQVSLANVVPVTGNHWSQQSVSWFRALVHNRTLYARLYPHGNNIAVELYLERGKLGAMRRGASLSVRLAQNGHAKHSELKRFGFSTALQKAQKQNSDLEKYLYSFHSKK